MPKPKASLNKAKDTETSKLKRINIPLAAKVEINRANNEINNFIAGVVVGMGIKGKWSLDTQKMQIIVTEDADGKNKT